MADRRAHRTAIDVALNLVPIAGITFPGFIGVARDRIGPREDQFFATLFLGSGLLFVAMLFVAAALADGLITDVASGSSAAPAPGTLAVGRLVTGLLLRVYATRMAAVFTLSTSIITFRTAVIPRRIAVLGFPVAVVLLISVGLTPWVELLFPAWVLLLSIDILWTGLRQPRSPAGTAMATGALPSASGLSAVPVRQVRGRAATAEGEEVTVTTPATQGAPSAGPRVGPAVARTRTASPPRRCCAATATAPAAREPAVPTTASWPTRPDHTSTPKDQATQRHELQPGSPPRGADLAPITARAWRPYGRAWGPLAADSPADPASGLARQICSLTCL